MRASVLLLAVLLVGCTGNIVIQAGAGCVVERDSALTAAIPDGVGREGHYMMACESEHQPEEHRSEENRYRSTQDPVRRQ